MQSAKIAGDDPTRRFLQGENAMKRLMSLMLGLALVSGSVVVIFAQDAPKKEEEGKKKKGKKKGGEEPKKETR